MDNLSDIYYLLQLIVRQIFVYLRDAILHEFAWFGVGNDDIGNSKMKSRFLPSSRHAIADFVALFIICTFLVVFVIIFMKSVKDDDEEHFSSSTIASRSGTIFPDDRIYTDIPYSMANTTNYGDCHQASGDIGHSVDTNLKNGLLGSLSFMKMKRSNPVTESMIHVSQSQHSQSTQTNTRALRRAACAQDWLIRRTRSGQVYGQYPI